MCYPAGDVIGEAKGFVRKAIERFFKVGERGSAVGAEVVGGPTTFLTMAYIVAVNPAMMQAAGMPFAAALTGTCLGAAVMTVAMGVIANRPIALASGMGINAIVAIVKAVGRPSCRCSRSRCC